MVKRNTLNNQNNQNGEPRENNIVLSIALIAVFFTVIIVIGIAGFMHFYKLSVLDSFYNASMYVTGMGPITIAETRSQKIFGAFYAIFGGFIFLAFLVYFVSEIADILFFPDSSQ